MPTWPPAASTVADVADRSARLLGVTSLDAATRTEVETALESVDLNTATRADIEAALESVDLNAATISAITTALESVDLNAATLAALHPTGWSAFHHPGGTGVLATATRAAVAGKQHVCTGVYASIAQSAGGAVTVGLNLRDGASGAGTILWSGLLAVTATSGTIDRLVIPGLAIPGSVNTAMTLEFTGAPAGTIEDVFLTGYDL